MASSIPAVLAFTATLLSTAVADDCNGFFTMSNEYKLSRECSMFEFCCGSCYERYCCTDVFSKLNEDTCNHGPYNTIPISAGIVSMIIILIFIIICCVCPGCCLYKMCRKQRPVMATTTTTVVTTQYPQQPTHPTTQYPQQPTNPATQYPQQPTNPATQYPGYQPVPAQPGFSAQPGYGGQVMPPVPYQGQPYAPGPPPPYQESGGYPAPYSQAAFDGSQAPYPLNPPVHPGYAHPPPPSDYNPAQPPYNPAYVELPKTGY